MLEIPRWFRAALAEAPEHRETRVAGTSIHLRCWGTEDRPGLVFVHGGAWRAGAAKDYGYPAELFVNAGVNYIALDFINVGGANGDIGMLIVFDDYDGLKTYLEHPLHVQFRDRYKTHFEKVLVYDFANQGK